MTQLIELPDDVAERYNRLKELYGISDAELFERMLNRVSGIGAMGKVMNELWDKFEDMDKDGKVIDVVNEGADWLLTERVELLNPCFVSGLFGAVFELLCARWIDLHTSLSYKAAFPEVGFAKRRDWTGDLRLAGSADLEWEDKNRDIKGTVFTKGAVDFKYSDTGNVLYQTQIMMERMRARQCVQKGINYVVVVAGFEMPMKEETLWRLEKMVGRIYKLERFSGLSAIFE